MDLHPEFLQFSRVTVERRGRRGQEPAGCLLSVTQSSQAHYFLIRS